MATGGRWDFSGLSQFLGVKNPRELGTNPRYTPEDSRKHLFFCEGNPWFVMRDTITYRWEKKNTRARLLAWYCSRKTHRYLLVLTTLYVSYEHNPGQNSFAFNKRRVGSYSTSKARIFVPGHFPESSHSPNQGFPWNAQQFSCFLLVVFPVEKHVLTERLTHRYEGGAMNETKPGIETSPSSNL